METDMQQVQSNKRATLSIATDGSIELYGDYQRCMSTARTFKNCPRNIYVNDHLVN